MKVKTARNIQICSVWSSFREKIQRPTQSSQNNGNIYEEDPQKQCCFFSLTYFTFMTPYPNSQWHGPAKDGIWCFYFRNWSIWSVGFYDEWIIHRHGRESDWVTTLDSVSCLEANLNALHKVGDTTAPPHPHQLKSLSSTMKISEEDKKIINLKMFPGNRTFVFGLSIAVGRKLLLL